MINEMQILQSSGQAGRAKQYAPAAKTFTSDKVIVKSKLLIFTTGSSFP